MFFKRVIVDRGHGPDNKKVGVYDPGAIFREHKEHSIVKTVAEALPLFNDSDDIDVILSPELQLNRLILWVNQNSKPGDILVALHMNAGGGTGCEVLYAGNSSPERKEQAALLSASLARGLGLKDRGAKPDSYTRHGSLPLLRRTSIPAFLLELGFIDNPKDVSRVLDHGPDAIWASLNAIRGAS